MTLRELGKEYLRQSEAIREKIRKLNKESGSLTPKQLHKLRGRILALYADAASLKTIGEHLYNYYGESDE